MLDYKTLSDEIAKSMVSVDFHSPQGGLVCLPLLYPSGGWVTIDVAFDGKNFFVNDMGGAYNEASMVGASNSFSKIAQKAAQRFGVSFDKRQFFSLNTPKDELIATIILVANTSKYAVEQTNVEIVLQGKAVLFNEVGKKLELAFSNLKNSTISSKTKFRGRFYDWDIDFLVEHEGKKSIFQTVTPNINSVNSTFANFVDLSDISDNHKPKCIAVLENKEKTPHVSLLTRTNTVIPFSASAEIYRKVA